MIVNSAIELYTVLLAWRLYDGFWAIFSGTGIGAIPFVVATIGTVLDAQEKENVSSKQIIRSLEVRFYSMLAVFFLAVTPFIDIYPDNTKYVQASCPADDSSAAVTSEKYFGASDTTLDNDSGRFAAMLGGHIPQAPLWWYVFSKLNMAVANSLKFELPCRADLVTVSANLASSSITDPSLRKEAAHFHNQCWLPASNKFLREHPSIPPSQEPIADNVSWLGSRFFMDTAGYYDSFRTDEGLQSFSYSVLHGDDAVSDGADGLGWPTCERWWSDGTDGLRVRLLKDVKNNMNADDLSNWNTASPTWFGSPTDANDQLLRTAITSPTKTSPQSQLPIANSHIDGGWGSVEGWVNGLAGVGVVYEGAFALMEAQALKAGAPVVQACILMLFVIVLPLLMFLSLYDVATLVTLTVVQFSIMFWSFLFALALWMNNFLLSALFDGRWLDMLNTGDQPMEMMLTLWIIRFMYVILPIIFSALLGVVGNNLGTRLESGMERMMSGAGKGAGSGPRKLSQKFKR
jgi:hypothetical protein